MLFPEKEVKVIAELDLEEAENLACQFKAAVEAHCDRIEVAGSIRRQKTKVHDIDFVVVTKNDAEWQKISEKLTPKSQIQLLRKQRHKSVCALPKRPFPIRLLPCKTLDIRHIPACPTGSADHNMWLAGYAISKGMRIRYS